MSVYATCPKCGQCMKMTAIVGNVGMQEQIHQEINKISDLLSKPKCIKCDILMILEEKDG